ncbi:hypothetical protein DP42_5302 [Burkholderia pseudomallei]|nr:hypothetical protein DP42_5302 [Burkholderia pseudomallei]
MPVPVPASTINVLSPLSALSSPRGAAHASSRPAAAPSCMRRAGRLRVSKISGSGISLPDASIAAATARAMSICEARGR